MRRQVTFAAVAAMLAMGLGSSPTKVAAAGEGPRVEQQNLQELFSIFHNRRPRGDRFTANIQSENEVPTISSVGRGKFEAELDDDTLEYELSFSGLEGVVTQSHIHIAQPNVNGGIMVWLCNTTTNPGPASFTGPACPAAPGGTVTGIIKASDVLAVNAQGIAAGEFGEFVAALKKELAYVNVHSNLFPGGEIRGQVNHKGR
jgi:hypothetical protein